MDITTLFEDPVALFSTLAVLGAIIVVVFLSVKVIKLMNSTHSED